MTSRGDRREDIFRDDQDWEVWLTVLGGLCRRFNWRCHAYCEMTNHYHFVVETPEANLSRGMRQLNGVYTQRSKRRQAQARYAAFVAEGVGQPSIWEGLRHQVFLGSDDFIEHLSQGTRSLDKLREVPRAQRRPLARSLGHYERTFPDRREAMARAFLTGVYTMQEIADHFGAHYSTVSRAVRWFENLQQRENA